MVRRKFLTSLTAAVALSALTMGCSYYKPAEPAFHDMLNQPYALDAGDRVRVTVFDQAGLSNTYQVDQSGHIAFPLVGAIPARGYTVKQIEGAIAGKLRGGYIKNPDVTVEIDRYRPFFIMGEVGAGGQYTYVPGMTVQNAIAISGGFSIRAEQTDADITRQVNGKVITGRVPITDPILPGDTIYVRERLF